MTTPEPVTPPRHRPVRIAPETFVIQATHGEGTSPLAVHMNALLIRGAEPVVVDTGCPDNRDRFLEDLFSLVDPGDVRWVFITHDDIDHYGNMDALLDACPNATLVSTWFLTERLAGDRLAVPPTRWRWVGDGETLTVGDRTLLAMRPPLFDSPTTRGLFDPTTGVYWASDCFATPVPRGMAFIEELSPEAWAGGFGTFQVWNSPWVSLVDRARYEDACRRIEDLGVTTIATGHGPTIGGGHVAQAFRMLRDLPDFAAPPQPGQPLLEDIVGAMTAAAA